jgi:hypothetical protein
LESTEGNVRSTSKNDVPHKSVLTGQEDLLEIILIESEAQIVLKIFYKLEDFVIVDGVHMVFSQECDDVTAANPSSHISIDSLEGVVDVKIGDSGKFLSGRLDSFLSLGNSDQKIFELLIG